MLFPLRFLSLVAVSRVSILLFLSVFLEGIASFYVWFEYDVDGWDDLWMEGRDECFFLLPPFG